MVYPDPLRFHVRTEKEFISDNMATANALAWPVRTVNAAVKATARFAKDCLPNSWRRAFRKATAEERHLPQKLLEEHGFDPKETEYYLESRSIVASALAAFIEPSTIRAVSQTAHRILRPIRKADHASTSAHTHPESTVSAATDASVTTTSTTVTTAVPNPSEAIALFGHYQTVNQSLSRYVTEALNARREQTRLRQTHNEAQLRENIKQAEESYRMNQSTVDDGLRGITSVVSVFGQRPARQVASFRKAATNLMEFGRLMSTGTAAVSTALTTTTTALAASPLAPFAALAAAASAIFEMTKADDENDGPSAQEVILQNQQTMLDVVQSNHREVMEGIAHVHHTIVETAQHLSRQIGTLHTDVREQFGQLDGRVNQLDLHLVQGFCCMQRQMLDFSVPTCYSLHNIQSDLSRLHEINARVESLLLQRFTETCDDIENYPSRASSPLLTMDEKEARNRLKRLERVILGNSPPHRLVNGALCDFSPNAITKITSFDVDSTHSVGSILGFLRNYASSILGIDAPQVAADIPNLAVFNTGLKYYLDLRQAFLRLDYDEDLISVLKIANTGTVALRFLQFLQNNSEDLFDKLLNNYQVAFKRVHEVYIKALRERGRELAKEMCDRIRPWNQGIVESTSKHVVQPFCADEQYTEHFKKWDEDYAKELDTALTTHLQCLSTFTLNLELNQEPTTAYPLQVFVQPAQASTLTATHQSLQLTSRKLIPLRLAQINTAITPRRPLTPVDRILYSFARSIPKELFFAERLGLGVVKSVYTVQGTMECRPHSTETCQLLFSIIIGFQRHSDSTFLPIQIREYQGVSTDSYFAVHKFDCEDLRSRPAIYADDRITAVVLSAWKNNQYVSSSEHPQRVTNLQTISHMIQEALITRRKEVVRRLCTGSTMNHTEFVKAKSECEAAYRIVEAFGKAVGFNASLMTTLRARMLNEQAIDKHLQDYLDHAIANSTLLPEFTNDDNQAMWELMMNHVFALRNGSAQNPIVETLQTHLGLLGDFANTFEEDHAIEKQEHDKLLLAKTQSDAQVWNGVVQQMETVRRENGELRTKLAALEQQNSQMRTEVLETRTNTTTLLTRMNELLNKLGHS